MIYNSQFELFINSTVLPAISRFIAKTRQLVERKKYIHLATY